MLKYALIALAGVGFVSYGPLAYAQATTKVVGTCGTATYTAGTMQYPTQDTTGAACSSGGGGGGSNASVGVVGSAAPASGTQTGGKTAAGNLVAGCVDTNGVICAPQAGTANRVLTATSISANTSTTVCPTATNPVTTEIFFTTAAVGIGVNGQSLTSATPTATATNSPDIYIGTANTLYTFPVAPTNIVTAYGAAGVVRCIQTLRQ